MYEFVQKLDENCKKLYKKDVFFEMFQYCYACDGWC